MAAATRIQRYILNELRYGPRTTRDINVNMITRMYPGINTYDGIHQQLRKLEDHELVRRIAFRPNKWELTSAGRIELA